MSAAHLPLLLHGEDFGDLITVGDRVTLFTVRRELSALDGRTFDTAEDARAAVMAALPPIQAIRSLAA